MSAPAIIVRFELGRAPRVLVEADHYEARALTDWIDTNERWASLLAEAVELAEHRCADGERPRPEVYISIPLEESRPRVRIKAYSPEDEARIRTWITTHDDLSALVELARELAERRAA
jgi:hypothetical protein